MGKRFNEAVSELKSAKEKNDEVRAARAKGRLDEMNYQKNMYNKINNPAKYHADQQKRAEVLAKYHEKQAAANNKR
jgi:hypothetical protein